MLILEQIVERVAAETGLRQDQVTELNMYAEGARHTTNQRIEADLVLSCAGMELAATGSVLQMIWHA